MNLSAKDALKVYAYHDFYVRQKLRRALAIVSIKRQLFY